jgi:hypothetical protein
VITPAPLDDRLLRLHGSRIEVLKRARSAAIRASHGDDGGSCNHDACVVWFPRGTRILTAMGILAAAGLSASRMSGGRWTGGYSLSAPIAGQGARLTRQAEAMHAVIEGSHVGLDASVFYLAD